LGKTRPESLTLTATALTHDPGNSLHATAAGKYAINVGTPRVIPWAESEEGCVLLTHDRLALRHGRDERVIGLCLREPEREWLAEVLRSWTRPGGKVRFGKAATAG
jgi:hypothetical protein